MHKAINYVCTVRVFAMWHQSFKVKETICDATLFHLYNLDVIINNKWVCFLILTLTFRSRGCFTLLVGLFCVTCRLGSPNNLTILASDENVSNIEYKERLCIYIYIYIYIYNEIIVINTHVQYFFKFVLR
jgi:hypothetical protein